MNNMLKERCALVKLRAELERREERMCRQCGRFGHLAQMYRSGKEEIKGVKSQSWFEVLRN